MTSFYNRQLQTHQSQLNKLFWKQLFMSLVLCRINYRGLSITYPKKKMKTHVELSLAGSHHIGSKHNQKQRESSNQRTKDKIERR